jgi:hypothetical protein
MEVLGRKSGLHPLAKTSALLMYVDYKQFIHEWMEKLGVRRLGEC